MESNCECRQSIVGSQSVGDKVHAQEGKSPDRQLRPQNDGDVESDVKQAEIPAPGHEVME